MANRVSARMGLVMVQAMLVSSLWAQDVPAPRELVCSHAYNHIHQVTWVNSAAYDGIEISRQIEGEETFSDPVILPGDATEALVGCRCDSSKQDVYRLRGVVGATFSAPLMCGASEPPRQPFVRGDANRDDTVSISDAVTMQRALFIGRWESFVFHGSYPPCVEAAEVDGNDKFELSDVIFVLRALFFGGPIFPEPFPLAAIDDSPGSHSCIEPVGAAPQLDESFIIEVGEAEGPPGELVTLPVHATIPVEIDAYSLSFQFDPEQVDIESYTFEGTIYATLPLNPVTNGGFQKLNDTAGPGVVTIGIVNNFTQDVRLPPLDHDVLLNLQVRILPAAVPGTTIPIYPVTAPGVIPIHNELSVLGEAVYAATYPILLDGALKVGLPPNVDFFRRGDVNGDGAADLSDAVATLGFLFLGDGVPTCLDAADSDDDGIVLITDPIALLGKLFLGTSTLKPPFPGCGADPTLDDALSCLDQVCP